MRENSRGGDGGVERGVRWGAMRRHVGGVIVANIIGDKWLRAVMTTWGLTEREGGAVVSAGRLTMRV